MAKNLISPQVYTFETDKSNQSSYYSGKRVNYGGDVGSGSDGAGGKNNNNENSYLLLENGFYLLQEDGSKIIL